MIRFILLDIEGTTTAIDFVHKTLFPYAYERLPGYVQAHQADEAVQACFQSVRDTVRAEESREIDENTAVETLLTWIRSDRKHPALKELQGLIWRDGYENGQYKGHVYDDVPEALSKWQAQGLKMGIYSSGSVFAQKLLFQYSTHGDLTGFFSRYFDTGVGPKQSADSYWRIVEALNLPAEEILFLSDVPAELDAAKSAGLKTVQVVRLDNLAGQPSPNHSQVTSLAAVEEAL